MNEAEIMMAAARLEVAGPTAKESRAGQRPGVLSGEVIVIVRNFEGGTGGQTRISPFLFQVEKIKVMEVGAD